MTVMPVGNIPGWVQIFTEDFTQPVTLGQFPGAVENKWIAYPYDWTDTSGKGTYSPETTVSWSNSVMRIRLHTLDGQPRVCAAMPKIGPAPEYGRLYGRYAVKFRINPIPGYKVAWLLWPDSDNWDDGEIDFPEAELKGTKIEAFSHKLDSPTECLEFQTNTNIVDGLWHVAIIEWLPSSVKFVLDNTLIGTITDPDFIPNTSMHYVLQCETDLTDNPVNPAVVGDIYVDWFVAYRPA